MNKGQKLTAKEEAFCAAYIETGIAAEAYRRAYDCKKSKPNTIYNKSSLLLDRDKIRQRIDELRAGHRKRHEVTVDRIVSELAKIAFAQTGDYFTWGPDGVKVRPSDELTDDQRAVVSEVSQTVTEGGGTIRVKLSDKQAALEKLGRHLGMFSDGPKGNVNNYMICDRPMSADEWEKQFAETDAKPGVGAASGTANGARPLPAA